MTASILSVSCDALTNPLTNPTGGVRKAPYFGSGRKDCCKWALSFRNSTWPVNDLSPLCLAIEVCKEVVEKHRVLQ